MKVHELLSGILSNESSFGRLMTRCGVIIGANLMFILFSFPVVTAGAAYVALYHVMFKALRGDGVINPFKQFWIGFKSNFKQATIAWICVLALLLLGFMDLRICMDAGGVIAAFRYPLYALGVGLCIIVIYLLPTMAAFQDTIPHLIRNSLFFAFRKPHKLLVMLFFNVFPMYLTYSDLQMMPLYAFLWCFFGFGAIAMLDAYLLLPEFKPYLPLVDDCGDFILDENGEKIRADSEAIAEVSGRQEKSQEEILEEMRKLGM